jgi:hypothetical protein
LSTLHLVGNNLSLDPAQQEMANFVRDGKTIAPRAVASSIADHEAAVFLFPKVAIRRHFSRFNLTDAEVTSNLADVDGRLAKALAGN